MKKQNQTNRWVWTSLIVIFGIFLITQLSSIWSSGDNLITQEKVGIVKLEGPIFDVEKVLDDLAEFSDMSNST